MAGTTRGTVRSVRALIKGTVADLRGHDIPLYAAGLTFYASLALIPLMLVVLRVASLIIGGSRVRSYGSTVAGLAPDGGGLSTALESVFKAGATLPVLSAVVALLVAVLYGEGLVRALDQVAGTPPEGGRGLKGRLKTVALLALGSLLAVVGLSAATGLTDVLGKGTGPRIAGIYSAFLLGWAGAGLLIALGYRLFGGRRLSRFPVAMGAAVAGSWASGSSLGFVFVLGLKLDFGRPFGGSQAVGAGVLVLFWLFLVHLVVLVGYALALRLQRGPAWRRAATLADVGVGAVRARG